MYSFLVVKNTGSVEYQVDVVAVGRADDESVVAVATNYVPVMAQGEESVVLLSFDNAEMISHIDYYFYYNDNPYYVSGISDVECTISKNGEDTEVTATNVGKMTIDYPYVYVLFFDENDEVIDYDWEYLVDDDGELKAGESVTAKLYAPRSYAYAKAYVIAYYY